MAEYSCFIIPSKEGISIADAPLEERAFIHISANNTNSKFELADRVNESCRYFLSDCVLRNAKISFAKIQQYLSQEGYSAKLGYQRSSETLTQTK